MDIGQLSSWGAGFELRYPHAYPLWDAAGKIASEAAQRWPTLVLREATPGQQKFRIGDNIEMAVLIDRWHVLSVGPKHNEDEFLRICRFAYDQAALTLRVPKFSRVGLRPTFLKRFNAIDEAVQAFVSTGLVRVPDGRHFGIEGKLALPECILRYESDQLGCMAHLKVQTRKVGILEKPLGDVDFDLKEVERHEFVFDIDYYTMSDVLVGQLKVEEWIRQAMQVVRRDAKIFLGG